MLRSIPVIQPIPVNERTDKKQTIGLNLCSYRLFIDTTVPWSVTQKFFFDVIVTGVINAKHLLPRPRIEHWTSNTRRCKSRLVQQGSTSLYVILNITTSCDSPGPDSSSGRASFLGAVGHGFEC